MIFSAVCDVGNWIDDKIKKAVARLVVVPRLFTYFNPFLKLNVVDGCICSEFINLFIIVL